VGFGPEFATCFEMYDGEAVIAALMREAERNPRLAAGIRTLFGGDEPVSWTQICGRFSHVATASLPAQATSLRVEAQRRFESLLAAERSGGAP